jgi:hypothetical protein
MDDSGLKRFRMHRDKVFQVRQILLINVLNHLLVLGQDFGQALFIESPVVSRIGDVTQSLAVQVKEFGYIHQVLVLGSLGNDRVQLGIRDGHLVEILLQKGLVDLLIDFPEPVDFLLRYPFGGQAGDVLLNNEVSFKKSLHALEGDIGHKNGPPRVDLNQAFGFQLY